MKIFPLPARMQKKPGVFDYSDSQWIKIDPQLSPNLRDRIIEFRDDISSCFSNQLQLCCGTPAKGRVLLEITMGETELCPQSYSIDTRKNSIILSGGDEAGVFYGLQTIKQIFLTGGNRLEGFKIYDRPDFPQRGIMLDVSRAKVPTLDEIFALIELMASLKFNQLQLYIEHTFAFSAHSRVWSDSSPFSAEDIIRIDAFCRSLYIELVPNFNSFGHFGRWLKHPEYKHLAECPDGFEYPWGAKSSHGSVLKPAAETLQLLDELYREYLPNFSSSMFNVGCDETWELGQGWSKAACQKRGETRVYLDFLLKIAELVKKHGRKMMFWGDIVIKDPKLVSELPKDIIALEWGYEAEHPFREHCACFRDAEVPFYVCPGTSSWNSLVGKTANCRENLKNAAHNGLANGAEGFLITDWGDGGHHQYLPFSYPGYFYGAAVSWGLRKNRNVDVREPISSMAFGGASLELASVLLEAGNVYQDIKKAQFNCTVFDQLLFAPLKDDYYNDISCKELKHCLSKFTELAGRVAKICCDNSEATLVKAEIANALALAGVAVKKGLYVKKCGSISKKAICAELQEIIGTHERLWLQRNRPGGLSESSGRLRTYLKALEE